MEETDDFRAAGRALFSLGLVKGSEGNLSTFGSGVLRITRAGARLHELGDVDVVAGRLDAGVLSGASSDLEVHRRMYRERGSGAIAHSHPPGTVPERGGGPGQHGLYTFAATLQEAVAQTVRVVRGAGASR